MITDTARVVFPPLRVNSNLSYPSHSGGFQVGWKDIVRLPLTMGASHMACGHHVTRYAMYEKLKDSLDDQSRGVGKTVLSISHSDILIPCLGLEKATITEANYPEHRATDLSAFDSNAFDYVVSDQVLEHIEGNPQDAFDETLRVLKPGGIAVHTTCMINPVHGSPSDYWRFTTDGLRYLARNFSEIIAADGVGNRAIWLADFMGLRYTPVPHAKWHPLHMIATRNNPAWPVSTWIVAKK